MGLQTRHLKHVLDATSADSALKARLHVEFSGAGDERDVIVHVLESAAMASAAALWSLALLPLWGLALLATLSGALLVALGALSAALLATLSAALLAVITTAKQLQFGSDDVARGFLNTGCFVGVDAVLDAAFDVARLALLEVLASNLGQAVIERDAVPLGVFDDLAADFVFAP